MNLPFVNTTQPFSYIVWGFFFHSIGKVFLNITQLQIIYAIICCIGWLYIIRGFYLMRKDLSLQVFGIQRIIFYLYLLLCAIMIIRGYLIDYPYLWLNSNGFINYHFFNPTYILPYLMPLVLFIPIEEYDFRPIVKISVILSIVVIICYALFYKQIIYSSIKQSLGILSSSDDKAEVFRYYGQLYVNVALIALCRKYVSSKVWFINTIALSLSFMITMISARRGDSVILLALLIFDLYFFLRSLSFKARIFATFLSSILLISCFFMLYDFNGFDYIKKRGLEDSRSHIDKALMEQMSEQQLIWGKGLNGRYHFDLHIVYDYLDGWRYVSETGYYNLILKGGYVLAWTYIIFLIIPSFLGAFKSNNLLCKVLAFIIFLSLLELYPFGHLTFNLKFLIIWMGIAINSNPAIRELDNNEIYQLYFKTNEDSLDN